MHVTVLLGYWNLASTLTKNCALYLLIAFTHLYAKNFADKVDAPLDITHLGVVYPLMLYILTIFVIMYHYRST